MFTPALLFMLFQQKNHLHKKSYSRALSLSEIFIEWEFNPSLTVEVFLYKEENFSGCFGISISKSYFVMSFYLYIIKYSN